MYLPYIDLEIKCAYCRCVLSSNVARASMDSVSEMMLEELKGNGSKVLPNGDTLCKDCKADGVE